MGPNDWGQQLFLARQQPVRSGIAITLNSKNQSFMKISTGILSIATVSALALMRAFAGDFVIDPFDQPGTGQETSVVPNSYIFSDSYASDVPGGRRLISLENGSGIGRSTVGVAAFAGGLFELENTARAIGRAEVYYGSSSTQPGGYVFQEDFSIYNAFRFSAVYSSAPTYFVVGLESHSSISYASITIPENNGSDLIIPFSSLAGYPSIDFTKVDAISFAVAPLKLGGAVEIGKFSVTAVPEPSTYGVLAGFGLLSWTAYRRVRR